MWKRTGIDPFLLLLLVVSLGLNVYLGVRVFRAGPQRNQPPIGLEAGTRLPPITARTTDNNSYTLSYGTDPRPTVLYTFSDTCKWCDLNSDNWDELVSRKKEEFRFVALSVAPAGSSTKSMFSDVITLIDLRPETRQAYRLGPTPTTTVVSSDGRVLKTWAGAYSGSIQNEIERYFSIKLPGLKQ